MTLTERMTEILKLNLAKNYTAASYAIMVDGEYWAADAVGTDGSKEDTPVTADHTFNVCSISKIFCTTAVMQLVEQGKLDLDTPVCVYLPRFVMPDERYKKITLRHCLSHSSGLPGTQWKHFSATHVGSMENTEYYDEVYRFLAKSHLKAEPGRYSVYCNDGFTLAEMAVAEVSGMPFAEYVKKNITDPIGAASTRTSLTVNPDYPLVCEKNKTKEYFYLQGCGGFTTTMKDLCLFGRLFLEKNSVISEESKVEMAKHQGSTFLPDDTAATSFGLGWDNVEVREPEYDLGDHVLAKGGNSFQFTSRLVIIPKYKAVLAISETHDCGLDVGDVILSMFGTAMLEKKGISIYRKYVPIPKELQETFRGTYLQPSRILNTHFFGTDLTFTCDPAVGKRYAAYKNLKYDGTNFVDNSGDICFFRKWEENSFLFTTWHGRTIPCAMRAEAHAPLSEAWKKRIGKKYIAVNLTEQDMVSHEMMTGFTGAELAGIPGIFVCSFAAFEGSDVYAAFEGCVIPVDDMTGRGFLLTPSNGSRDLIDPFFTEKDGIEYCEAASYLYRDAETLPVYAGETFADVSSKEENAVYILAQPLEELPEVPEGRRLMVFAEDMSVAYDSQIGGIFKKQEKGYLSLI